MPSNCPSRATVLPKKRLMVLSSALACLHIDWGFIGLNVTAPDQLSPHRSDHRDQQLADFEDPAVQRRAADFQADVPFQNHALPMQRCVIAIFADDRVDDDAVTRQAPLDDPQWQWGRNHPKFLTRPASPFLSFRDQHKILHWLHIQLGILLVANHDRFSAAAFAHALIRRARQNSLYARKIRSHFVAARMLAGSVRRAPPWRVLTLPLLNHFTDNGLNLKQLHNRKRTRLNSSHQI